MTRHAENTTRSLYTRAQDELEATLRSRSATREQKRLALDAMDELDRRFLQRATGSLEARSSEFAPLVEALDRITNAMEASGSPISSLKSLRAIVQEARARQEEPQEGDGPV